MKISLEQHIELRKIFYFLDYQLIIKGYNSGTARWKRCIGQGMGIGHEDPMLFLKKTGVHMLTNPEPCPSELLWKFSHIGMTD